MAFLDDFANAVSTYPTNLEISIVDRALVTGTTPAININEVWSFQVRVKNKGNLNMTGLSMHVVGVNGATVGATATGPWSNQITVAMPNINARDTQDSVNCFFKAPSTAKPAGTVLVSSHVNSFDANLNYILNTLSVHSALPEGKFSDQVFP